LEFWDFSIDEFAFHDIPDSIAYILETTRQDSLSYIGFSQGTAQAFASLAIHPKLNSQVNVFIALAPAMAPAGLSNGVVDSLVKASPSVLFLLFGRRSILSSATMWETLLYPPLFSRLIDMGLSFLFGWRTRNISSPQKLAAYPHLYSFTSTKSVVHWFQIIRNKCFQMYDDDVHQPMSVSTSRKYSKVAKYPTRNIRTPVVLVYGGSDSLVDIKAMLRELPPQTVATEIPHYEHLDFLWARDVNSQVFQHVFDALDSFTDADHSKDEYDRYFIAREESLIGSRYTTGRVPRGSESDTSTVVGANEAGNGGIRQHIAREQGRGAYPPRDPTRTGNARLQPADDDAWPSSPEPGNRSPHNLKPEELPAAATSPEPSEALGSTKLKGTGVRRGSAGTKLSLDSMKEGRGISVGASKTAGGVVTTGASLAEDATDVTKSKRSR
jgi:lysosomal acid lipase/cholesteryl ester hydrolase